MTAVFHSRGALALLAIIELRQEAAFAAETWAIQWKVDGTADISKSFHRSNGIQITFDVSSPFELMGSASAPLLITDRDLTSEVNEYCARWQSAIVLAGGCS